MGDLDEKNRCNDSDKYSINSNNVSSFIFK